MANKSRAKDEAPKAPDYGWPKMLRDVLIASMNKGQLPAAGLVLVILSLIWRLPPSDVSNLVFRLLDDFENWRLTGWVLAVVFLGCWAVHARIQRRLITGEMRRISKEKTQLQDKAIPGKVKSSERR